MTAPCQCCGLPVYQGSFKPDHPKRCCLRECKGAIGTGEVQCLNRGRERLLTLIDGLPDWLETWFRDHSNNEGLLHDLRVYLNLEPKDGI